MDKNNDLIQMLRDREDEFHLPLGDDGWEKLEAGLSASGQAPLPLQAAPVVARRLPRMWWTVAAVGFLCLLVSLPLFMRKAPENMLSDKPQQEVSHPVLSAQPEERPLAETHTARPKPAKAVQATFPELMPELLLTDTTVLLPQPTELYASRDGKKPRKHVGPQPERKPAVFDYQLGDNMPMQKQRWSFGIQGGSNALSNMNGGLSHMEGMVSDPGPKPDPDPLPPITDPDPPITNPDDPDDKPSTDSPRTKAAVGNGGGGGNGSSQDVYYYYRHRLPVTVSLSLRRHLFRQLALETGLSYTYLHADILEDRKEVIGSQRLHYIGIPLKLSWTFYQGERFSLYASGGGLIEYCVSAVNTEKDLNICRWQPSWNATAGMQVTLLKPWSLYLEPGVSYFYVMNRNLRGSYNRFETIRTVHPFTFNLQVGLRFTY